MTFDANFAKNKDSCKAVSPPPTTNTSTSLKNAASQVAQYDTPAPTNSSSPFTPNLLCFEPIAIIT